MAWLMAEQFQERAFLVIVWYHRLHLNMLRYKEEVERFYYILDSCHRSRPVLDELIHSNPSPFAGHDTAITSYSWIFQTPLSFTA